MAKKVVEGNCRICGVYGPLSEEHVPPKREFNGMPFVRLSFEQVMALGPDEIPDGKEIQGGVRFPTLCRQCNNDTGGWYARAFVEWCYQGMTILERSGGNPRLVYAHHIFPMRVIKQIITMFFSVNTPRFRDTAIGRELVWLIQNREEKGLPRDVRFYAYFNLEGQVRYNPIVSLSRFHEGKVDVLSEITYPPFGYVMAFGAQTPDHRLFDITHFAWSDYDETRTAFLDLPLLPTHLMGMSGDYRGLEEISEQIELNARRESSVTEPPVSLHDQLSLLDGLIRGQALFAKYRG